jgi:hypothetical protein
MMAHVEHRTHNGGLAALGNRLRDLKNRGVRVGYIKGKSQPQNADAEDGVAAPSCAQVAAWNVYGVIGEDGRHLIPARNFMAEGLREGRDELWRLNRINLILVLRGQMPIDRALGQLGAMAMGWMKRMISTSKSWAVPNAPSTVLLKGSDQPLKDTGNMTQALTWSVEK